MKIKIQQYFKKNRDRLDVEEPDESMLWEGIKKGLAPEGRTSPFNQWKVAAILLAIISISYVIYNEVSKERNRDFTLAQIHHSLDEREKEYKNMVLEKMQAANIEEFDVNKEEEIILVLINELQELDTIYHDAMQDLKTHGYLERTVDIIFDTYEKRIHLLELIIMESQKIERYENDQREIVL